MSLYDKYATLRDSHGLNDYKVAKATGIEPSIFSSWKAGRYEPKIDKRKKIADLLGVSVDYFIE